MSVDSEIRDAAGVDQPTAASSQSSDSQVLSAETTTTASSSLSTASSRRRRMAHAAAMLVPFAATLVLTLVLSFSGGGYLFVQAAPWVLGWFAVLLVWVIAVRPSPRIRVAMLAALAGLAAMTLWAGLSILWSVGPDLSWIAFDYAVLYLAFGVMLSLAAVRAIGLRLAAYGCLVVAVVISIYAMLGKVLPEYVTHAHEYARLQAPVGYWNVLAVMMVMGSMVALSLAARRSAPPLLRAASASATALLLITLFFTFSRGGFLAAAVALIVYFAAARERLSSLLSLLAVAVSVVPSLYAVRGLQTVFQHTNNSDLRTAQGHTLGVWVLVALVAVFALQLVIGLVHRRLEFRPVVLRWVGIAVLAVVVAGVVGGPLVYMQRHGGVIHWTSARWTEFINGPPSEGGDSPNRLFVVSSNGRVDLYRTALRQVPHSELLGTGAGTFAFTNYRYRDVPMVVKHAHSQWFNELSELGIPGLVFFFVFIAGVVVTIVWQLVRYRRDVERGLLAACAAGCFAFIFHISGDWDWDMAAITAAFFVMAAAVCSYQGSGNSVQEAEPTGSVEGDTPNSGQLSSASGGNGAAGQDRRVVMRVQRPATRLLPLPATVLIAGLLLVAGASWLVPWLSSRATDNAVAALNEGRFQTAVADARSAISLNPLAVEPLITLSLAQQGRGLSGQATAALQTAIRMQPENWWLHYRMGVLLANLGRDQQAAAQFRRTLQLNPLDGSAGEQLEQVQSR